MADFKSGVKDYLVVESKLSKQGFPIDFNDKKYIACAYCHLYERHDNICFDTKEIIFQLQTHIGYRCPYMDAVRKRLNKE